MTPPVGFLHDEDAAVSFVPLPPVPAVAYNARSGDSSIKPPIPRMTIYASSSGDRAIAPDTCKHGKGAGPDGWPLSAAATR